MSANKKTPARVRRKHAVIKRNLAKIPRFRQDVLEEFIQINDLVELILEYDISPLPYSDEYKYADLIRECQRLIQFLPFSALHIWSSCWFCRGETQTYQLSPVGSPLILFCHVHGPCRFRFGDGPSLNREELLNVLKSKYVQDIYYDAFVK